MNKLVGHDDTTPLNVVWRKNNSGGDLVKEDLVITDISDVLGRSVKTIAIANSSLRYGVVQEKIKNGEFGMIAIAESVITVKCKTEATAIAIGNDISTSATAKVGTLGTSNRIGIALSALSANTSTPTAVTVLLRA